MDIMALKKMVSELLIAISALTGQAAPAAGPDILLVSHHELAQRLCGRPCPVHAYFDPNQGILIDDRMDLAGDVNARSVLVHELVHYLQWRKTGRGPKDCFDWLQREREAYIAQHRWLNGQSPNAPRSFKLTRPLGTPVVCARDRSYAFGG